MSFQKYFDLQFKISSGEEMPGVIRKLDDEVVKMLSTGQVIQRPVNAVKELLENSLDAGSKQITVIVKNGSGAVIVFEDGTWSESPVHPVTDLVDTTAAGDSFNAGVLAGYAKGAPTQSSVAFACNLARAVVQQRGALVPIAADELTLDEKT